LITVECKFSILRLWRLRQNIDFLVTQPEAIGNGALFGNRG